MKQPLFSALIIFTLFTGFSCSAQYGEGESKTSAGNEYSTFDTSQQITGIIPKARRYKSPELLRLQVSGNPKAVKLTEYNYITIKNIDNVKMLAWGVYAVHDVKIQGGRILSATATSYSILNAPTPSFEAGMSYKLSDYKKDHIKISAITGEEALIIDFLNYSMYVDSTGNLIRKSEPGKYDYNDNGDCIRVTTDESNRQLRYFYQYDGQHNWTQRFLWDSDYGIIQKIDRKISY